MEHGFSISPSQSPHQAIFPGAHYLESTSESSSPRSPSRGQLMFNSQLTQYEMDSYNHISSSFYTTQPNRVPVEYIGPTILDDRDGRWRRSGSSSTTSKDKDSTPTVRLRRRAQNRASQRAFRERKEKHVKGLEHQLDGLHEKHQDLLQSYTRQASEVTKLTHRISELMSELESARSSQDRGFSDSMIPEKFDNFDAFPSHEMYYNGPESYFDINAVNINEGLALHSFEDSL